LDIEDWRNEIDQIDERLVELLNQRAQCAIEIGRIKRQLGLPVYTPEREKEVVEHVAGRNSGPLEPDAVRRLFERIIDESRSLERKTVAREQAEKGRSRLKEGRSTAKKKARQR
jgi:chorismate mutase